MGNISGPSSTVSLHTGTAMPVIGLGTWELQNPVQTVVKALELGYRLIDTSGNYGTQPGIAEALKQSPFDRNEIFIVSKIEAHENSYEASVQNLHELQIDYADLMLIHWPPQESAGLDLWQGLIRAKKAGLVKDIGVSNYPISLLDSLINESGEKPVVNQIEWTPFGFSEEMLTYCNNNNIIIQAYSPITRGEHLDNAAIESIAAKYSKSVAQIILRWNIQRGTVPLPKSSSEAHLKENITIFDFEIDPQDMEKLNSLNMEKSAMSGGSLPYL